MRIMLAGLLSVILLPAIATAQEVITSYELLIYAPGASTPQMTSPLPLSSVTCGLVATPIPAGPAVNPDRVSWVDPADATKRCQVVIAGPGAPFVALPSGSYEGTVRAVNTEGPGAAGNRDPFVRRREPAAVTGIRFTRAGQ